MLCRLFFAFSIVLLVLPLAGCPRDASEPVRTETPSSELSNADRLRAKLDQAQRELGETKRELAELQPVKPVPASVQRTSVNQNKSGQIKPNIDSSTKLASAHSIDVLKQFWKFEKHASVSHDSFVGPEFSFTSLINRLNLRTVNVDHGFDIEKFCQSYLGDIISGNAEVSILDTEMEIRQGSDHWIYTLVYKNQIQIETIKKGELVARGQVEIKYVSHLDEWRGDMRYQPVNRQCVDAPYTDYPLQPVAGKYYVDPFSATHAENPLAVEGQSYGEFNFASVLLNTYKVGLAKRHDAKKYGTRYSYEMSTPLYRSAIDSEQVGRMKLKVKTSAYEGENVSVWFLDQNDLPLVEKAYVHYRAKDYPSLFVFYILDDRWLRMTPYSEKPLWIDNNSLAPSFRKSLMDRGKVFEAASSLTIESPHRVRSEPSLDGEVLASIVSSIGDITPREVRGDWLKIHYVARKKDGLFETVLNRDYGDGPIRFDGWIKWRKLPGEEYVSPLYWVEGKQY